MTQATGLFIRAAYIPAAYVMSVGVLLGGFACSKTAPQDPLAIEQPARVSYLTPRYLDEAIDKLLEPLARPVRVLSLTALHGVVVLHVQDPKNPRQVVEYRLADNRVTGPVPVELKGPGKLADNLFRADALDAHVASKVLTQVRSEYSEDVRKLVLTRNLPTSMDIQFRVFLKTPAGDRIVTADKNGRLLGPLTTPSSPTNSPPSP